MRFRHLTWTAAALAVALVAVPRPADAQIGKLKDAAKRAVENEAANQVERLLREAIRCAVDDPRCPEQAEREGKPVIYTDAEGEVITDDEGAPITDREQAAARAGTAPGAPPPPKPGEGVWANYDFVPGDRVLFYEDLSDDRVGDFPRRFEFLVGNMEVVEWEGGHYLRATNTSRLAVPLPEALPERFTIEFDYHQPAGHNQSVVFPSAHEGSRNQYQGSYFQVGNTNGVLGAGPESTTKSYMTRERMTPVRIQIDGSYVKMYLAEQRVANVPNAEIVRGDRVVFELIGNQKNPAYLGSLKIAAGGRDLYDRLETEGRVATQGIYFATNSDRIRPESTATLKEIESILTEHADLRLRIEGHTDSDGDEAHNQNLSERRAASVKRYLVEQYGIDASRLETAGFGESQPVADNATPEGKQKNRRVELVKL